MKLKLEIEFETFGEMVAWAENPDFANLKAVQVSATANQAAKAAKAEANGEVKATESDLLGQIKAAGIALSNKERYDGVQAILKSYGVVKITKIPEEDQPEVLKKMNKMLDADGVKYKKMLEALNKVD
jgi:hypothetical protein